MKFQPLFLLLKIAFSKERVVSYSDFANLDKVQIPHLGQTRHSVSDIVHARGNVIMGSGGSVSQTQPQSLKEQVCACSYGK